MGDGVEVRFPFVRGDANGDKRIDLADPIFTLNYMFREGEPPRCADAADANDDGNINIADPIFLLSYLFRKGAPPPAPFVRPGVDRGGDILGCRLGVGRQHIDMELALDLTESMDTVLSITIETNQGEIASISEGSFGEPTMNLYITESEIIDIILRKKGQIR